MQSDGALVSRAAVRKHTRRADAMNARPMHTEPCEVSRLFPANIVQPMLTIMLMSGKEDGGKRATLAFVAAVSAAAMGRPVQVFMAGDGARWGDPDEAEGVAVEGFPPLDELIRAFLDLGGQLLVCSTCARFCMPAQPGGAEHRWPSLQVRGMAAMLESQGGGSSLSF
jgi:predicted peroxiredoxin